MREDERGGSMRIDAERGCDMMRDEMMQMQGQLKFKVCNTCMMQRLTTHKNNTTRR